MKGMKLEWEGHDKALSTKLWEFFNEEYLVDFSVTCHGQQMKVHKFILAFMFPILKESLRSSGTFCFEQQELSTGVSPGQSSKIPEAQCLSLDNVADHAEDIEFLIQFAYTGKATVPKEHASCIRRIADSMEIKSLKDSLGRYHDESKLEDETEQSSVKPHSRLRQRTQLKVNLDESLDIVSINEDDDDDDCDLDFHSTADEDSRLSSNCLNSADDYFNDCTDSDGDRKINISRKKKTKSTLKGRSEDDGGKEKPTKSGQRRSSTRTTQKLTKIDSGEDIGNSSNLRDANKDKSMKCSRQFTCKMCKKLFESRTQMEIHREWNCGMEPPTCKYCGHTTNRKEILLRHIMAKHHVDADGNPLEKNVKCPKCDFVCYAKHQLRAHSAAKHDLIDKYKCKECSFTAPARSRLVKHERIIHQNRRDFMCEECGNRYQTSGTLNHHVLVTHKGVKPYKCDICGVEYKNKSCYNFHMQSHVGNVEHKHICDTCGYRTKRRHSLRLHMRKEHGIELESGNRQYDKLPATSSDRETTQTTSRDVFDCL